jgi:hypothetical protein
MPFYALLYTPTSDVKHRFLSPLLLMPYLHWQLKARAPQPLEHPVRIVLVRGRPEQLPNLGAIAANGILVAEGVVEEVPILVDANLPTICNDSLAELKGKRMDLILVLGSIGRAQYHPHETWTIGDEAVQAKGVAAGFCAAARHERRDRLELQQQAEMGARGGSLHLLDVLGVLGGGKLHDTDVVLGLARHPVGAEGLRSAIMCSLAEFQDWSILLDAQGSWPGKLRHEVGNLPRCQRVRSPLDGQVLVKDGRVFHRVDV